MKQKSCCRISLRTREPRHLGRLPCAVVALLAKQLLGATLDLNITDEQGSPLPSRVLIRPIGGECIVPPTNVSLAIGPDRWFFSAGQSSVEVSSGKLLLRVERGLEFVRVKEVIEVTEPGAKKTVVLKRWVNMKDRGYLCGENHLHVDSISLAPMLVAEGLDFGTSLTWWNGPDARRPVPAGEERIRNLAFAGQTVPTSIYDAELEYGWGAAYIQNLPVPLPLAADSGRPNFDYLRHAVDSGATVHYQGGWSREVALDALLGTVHTINICNNNFHLHRFQPRSRYSNLLQVDGFPVYPNTELGMFHMNTETYYRLLNWGLRLAAGAGSATGAKQVPVGYNRAYVRADPGTSLPEFNRAWANGKNFVTNGPMIFLKTSDGLRPGDSMDLPANGGKVGLQLEVQSNQPLERVEIVLNGSVISSFEINDKYQFLGEVEVSVESGAWVAARCIARDDLLSDEELAGYRSGSPERLSSIQHPSRIRFAHTSPIYFTVNGAGPAVRESIDEGLRMLDRLESYTIENAAEDYRRMTLDRIENAREILQMTRSPKSEARNPKEL